MRRDKDKWSGANIKAADNSSFVKGPSVACIDHLYLHGVNSFNKIFMHKHLKSNAGLFEEKLLFVDISRHGLG